MAVNRPALTTPPSLVGLLRSHRPAHPGAPKWLAGFKSSSSAVDLPQPLGKIGPLELKLAERAKEVKRAQRLRYNVFFQEMSATADPIARIARRDMDRFDALCDHLLVLDHAAKNPAAALFNGLRGFDLKGLNPAATKPKKPKVVGTYRLLRQEVADEAGGFYTSGEFGIDDLIARHRGLSFLELGRSCVLKPYRDKRTVELLWHGIWAYVLAHRVDVMLGCASLEGTDPEKLKLPLSYLHHFHQAPEEWRAGALPERKAKIDLLPKEMIDPRAALRTLPPLIKGYLRLGAFIGDGAVVDHQFGTTDVLIVLPRSVINPRYVDYYGADASRHAA